MSFEDHPNLTPEVNAAICDSELSGGVWFNKLPVGSVVTVQTRNTLYTIERRKDGDYISGNERYCPVPVKTQIQGSTFGGSMIKLGWIGIGMHMEFWIAEHGTLTSSAILDFKVR
jgi:hypothetical protein